jgi:hypothetical protein
VSTRSLGSLQRALLLGALVLGVIGMHQLVTVHHLPGPAAPVMSASMQPSLAPANHDDPMDGVIHDLMHLCLAVLGAVGTALLLLSMGRGLIPATHLTGRSATRTPARPPPHGGRSLLASVCVLRL